MVQDSVTEMMIFLCWIVPLDTINIWEFVSKDRANFETARFDSQNSHFIIITRAVREGDYKTLNKLKSKQIFGRLKIYDLWRHIYYWIKVHNSWPFRNELHATWPNTRKINMKCLWLASQCLSVMHCPVGQGRIQYVYPEIGKSCCIT